MKVLLAQVAVADGSLATNLQTLQATLAAHPEAELAVFPEMFLPGYDTSSLRTRSLTLDSPELQAVADAAAASSTAVVVGFSEITATGIANAAACVDSDGRLAGIYRKTHLFGTGETRAFQAGEEYVLVELCGVRVGVQICFDTEFPEPARAMALAGAELIVTASANMAPYDLEHRLGAAARAIENRLPHVYVNRTGVQSGFTFLGDSAAIDAGGRDLARLGSEPTTALVEVPIGADTVGEVDYLRLMTPPLPVRDESRTGVPR